MQNFVLEKSQIYDLEERTFQFAKNIRLFLKKIKQTTLNRDDHIQLRRSSGSVGGNYIEADESLGKKDFALRIKISRKEAKESAYWLRLILETEILGDDLYSEGKSLFNEAIQLKKIFSSIFLNHNRILVNRFISNSDLLIGFYLYFVFCHL